MSQEIRRVPLNWEHPKDEQGNYLPLFDRTYKEEAFNWICECLQWENGTHPDLLDDPELKTLYPFFWDWSSMPPEKKNYLPESFNDSPPLGYQIYETVSEGTPISPVFDSQEALQSWLINQGYSAKAVDSFLQKGRCPSLVLSNGHLHEELD